MHKAASKAQFDAEIAKLDARLLRLRDWRINSRDYPVLDITFGASFPEKSQRIKLICDDWNDLPPSIKFLTPDGETSNSIKRDPAGIINESAHPITGVPFVCTPGSREYHTHTSHTDDLWTNHKNTTGFDLGGILTKVWKAWKNSIQ